MGSMRRVSDENPGSASVAHTHHQPRRHGICRVLGVDNDAIETALESVIECSGEGAHVALFTQGNYTTDAVGCAIEAMEHGRTDTYRLLARGSKDILQVLGITLEFRVIWEICIEADNPKEAVREARAIQLTATMLATIFDVWDQGTGVTHRIDLLEDPDRLNHDELVDARTRFRLLQCEVDAPARIRNLSASLLIFLDRDNMLLKRAHPRRQASARTSEADSR